MSSPCEPTKWRKLLQGGIHARCSVKIHCMQLNASRKFSSWLYSILSFSTWGGSQRNRHLLHRQLPCHLHTSIKCSLCARRTLRQKWHKKRCIVGKVAWTQLKIHLIKIRGDCRYILSCPVTFLHASCPRLQALNDTFKFFVHSFSKLVCHFNLLA